MFNYVKISVVTPSYNQAEFLERTLISVLSQGYPNLEYIVIDGGSTDGSVEIIKKYEKHLAYWISEPDKGQSDAINRGFQRSAGKILAYLNSDDTYKPGTFLKVAQAYMKNPNADLLYGNVDIIDANDKLIDKFRTTKIDPLLLTNYRRYYLHQQGAFWTRDAYDRAGGFDPGYQFCMDVDFFCRIAETAKFVRINDCLANFRIHGNSKSSKMKQIYRIENEEIMRRYVKDNKRFDAAYPIWEMKRVFLLMMQGDTDYILGKACKKAKGLLSRR